MEGVVVIILLVGFGWVVPAVVNYYLAKDKGFGPVGWCILGIIFSWLSTIVVLCLPDMRRDDKR